MQPEGNQKSGCCRAFLVKWLINIGNRRFEEVIKTSGNIDFEAMPAIYVKLGWMEIDKAKIPLVRGNAERSFNLLKDNEGAFKDLMSSANFRQFAQETTERITSVIQTVSEVRT